MKRIHPFEPDQRLCLQLRAAEYHILWNEIVFRVLLDDCLVELLVQRIQRFKLLIQHVIDIQSTQTLTHRSGSIFLLFALVDVDDIACAENAGDA